MHFDVLKIDCEPDSTGLELKCSDLKLTCSTLNELVNWLFSEENLRFARDCLTANLVRSKQF